MARAIAACIPSRHRRDWFRRAPRAECWEFLPGLVGVMQATEVIKLILGMGEPLIGRLLLIDALGMKFRELKLRKNPDCPVCGTHPTVTKLIDYNEFCGIRGEEKPVSSGVPEIQVEELKRRLDAKEDLFVLDVREPHEYQICNLRRISDSAERSAEARERTRLQPRDRRPLQDGRTQRQGRSVPAAGGIQEGAQPGRRDYGLVGSRGSEGAEVLMRTRPPQWCSAIAVFCRGIKMISYQSIGQIRIRMSNRFVSSAEQIRVRASL